MAGSRVFDYQEVSREPGRSGLPGLTSEDRYYGDGTKKAINHIAGLRRWRSGWDDLGERQAVREDPGVVDMLTRPKGGKRERRARQLGGCSANW